MNCKNEHAIIQLCKSSYAQMILVENCATTDKFIVDMEFPDIGETCVICHREDYLPFKCEHCDKVVCIDHKANHGIECPINRDKFEKPDTNLVGECLKQSCDFCLKITLKLELVDCEYCKGNYCLYHRHQVQHDCGVLNERKELDKKRNDTLLSRQKEALDKLKEFYKASTVTTTHSKPIEEHKDSKKRALSQKIRLMKIRQTAKGPPNILEEDRIYFQVKFEHQPKSTLSVINKAGAETKIFTTSKHTLGRMIDFVADELFLKNKNHIEGASQLVFKKQLISPETVILDNQKLFSHYLENEILETGDEILITYMEE